MRVWVVLGPAGLRRRRRSSWGWWWSAGSSGVDGGRRWLEVGSQLFQPSEFAKIGLLLVLADILGNPPRRHRYLIALAVAAVPIGLTLIEPDLSTSMLLVIVFAAVAIQARVRVRSLLATAVAAAGLAPIGLALLRPYQLARLQAFLSGGASALGSGWTVLQAHIAIASAGLLGRGSAVPYPLLSQYLPARETDLALVSLVEQRGLLAGAAVFALHRSGDVAPARHQQGGAHRGRRAGGRAGSPSCSGRRS